MVDSTLSILKNDFPPYRIYTPLRGIMMMTEIPYLRMFLWFHAM